MRAISAMQNSGGIVSAMGQDIPQRVLSEPVSVPWMAIRKTVNATPCHHDLRIQLAVRERQIGTHRLHPIVRRALHGLGATHLFSTNDLRRVSGSIHRAVSA